MEKKIRSLKIIKSILWIVVLIIALTINRRIAKIDKNQEKKIELLTEQNKIYKKLSNPKYLTENEINENKKILNITNDNLNQIKEDKISEDIYWFLFVILIFVFWKLNDVIQNKIESRKNVA